MEAGHWDYLARILRQHGIEVAGAELKALPHDVELSDRVLARMAVTAAATHTRGYAIGAITSRRAGWRSRARPRRRDVRVGVGGHREVALADELADPRPGHAAQVQQRDPAVAEVVRREERDRRRPCTPSRSTSAARRRRSRRTAGPRGRGSSRGGERRLERVGEHAGQLDPERPPRLRRRRAQAHPAARLVVVADERQVDARRRGRPTSRARAAAAGAWTGSSR